MTTDTAEPRFALVDHAEHERTRAALEIAAHQRGLLMERLARVLVHVGKLTPFAPFTGSDLMLKAAEFITGPSPAETEEAFDDAAKARDEAGFIGTPAECIRFLDAERQAAESRLSGFDWVAGVYEGEELTRDKIGAELHDYRFMLGEVPKVYDHVTGGLLSKQNYHASGVISASDDHFTRLARDEAEHASKEAVAVYADALREIIDALAPLKVRSSSVVDLDSRLRAAVDTAKGLVGA